MTTTFNQTSNMNAIDVATVKGNQDTKKMRELSTANNLDNTDNKKAISALLVNTIHLPEDKAGQVYIPLCAKPSFLAMLDEHPHLLGDAIRHCLATTTENQDVLIFIADGDVMDEAGMAMDSAARVRRITSSVAAQLKVKVDDALSEIETSRVKDVIHWDKAARSDRFQEALASMESMMRVKFRNEEEEKENWQVAQVQHHVKTLVKNLYTQRVQKAQKSGSNVTNVFTGEGLEIRGGNKYTRRYRHLERACLLELCMILVGLESGDQTFTEMRYLTNDPQGMTYIASCLQDLRRVLTASNDASNISKVLFDASSTSHGITFVEHQARTRNVTKRVSVARAA